MGRHGIDNRIILLSLSDQKSGSIIYLVGKVWTILLSVNKLPLLSYSNGW